MSCGAEPVSCVGQGDVTVRSVGRGWGGSRAWREDEGVRVDVHFAAEE